jgi:CBS domain-containing protein
MESRLSTILKDKGNAVYSVSPETHIHECAEKMSALSVGALLVIKDTKLIGILSERDIICKVVSLNLNIENLTASDVMSTELVTVDPSMTVTEAMRLVTEKRFRHLPVIENGQLIGLISIGDLTRCAMLAQKNEISTLTEYIHGS